MAIEGGSAALERPVVAIRDAEVFDLGIGPFALPPPTADERPLPLPADVSGDAPSRPPRARAGFAAGASGPRPFLESIQRAFGGHDREIDAPRIWPAAAPQRR